MSSCVRARLNQRGGRCAAADTVLSRLIRSVHQRAHLRKEGYDDRWHAGSLPCMRVLNSVDATYGHAAIRADANDTIRRRYDAGRLTTARRQTGLERRQLRTDIPSWVGTPRARRAVHNSRAGYATAPLSRSRTCRRCPWTGDGVGKARNDEAVGSRDFGWRGCRRSDLRCEPCGRALRSCGVA